jgi:hypothetical protein
MTEMPVIGDIGLRQVVEEGTAAVAGLVRMTAMKVSGDGGRRRRVGALVVPGGGPPPAAVGAPGGGPPPAAVGAPGGGPPPAAAGAPRGVPPPAAVVAPGGVGGQVPGILILIPGLRPAGADAQVCLSYPLFAEAHFPCFLSSVICV